MAARVLCGLALVGLAACGAVDSTRGPTVLTWLTPPDRADLTAIARVCSEQSDGAYRIEVETLAADIEVRRTELIDRLRARDDSIDIVGLDTSTTPELAASGLLRPIPAERRDGYLQGVSPQALGPSVIGETLVTVPWWYDPWLLWYRGAFAERAGLDTAEPITWTDLIATAARVRGTIQIDDDQGRGTAAWVNGLIASAGGGPIDGPAGERAAEIVAEYARAGVGPGPSAEALTEFASIRGAFLVAPASVRSDPALATVAAELKSVPFPVVDRSRPGSPGEGLGLTVPVASRHAAQAFDAIGCLIGEDAASALEAAGHSPARAEPTEALDQVVPEPRSPQASVLRQAIDDRWSRPAAVGPGTPADTARASR